MGRGQWHRPYTTLPLALPGCSPGHPPDAVSAVTQIPAEQHLATPSTPRAAQAGASLSKPPEANFSFPLLLIPPQIFLCFLPSLPDSSSLGNKNPFLCSPFASLCPCSHLLSSLSINTFHLHRPLAPCAAPSPPPPFSFLCSVQVVPPGFFPGGRGL